MVGRRGFLRRGVAGGAAVLGSSIFGGKRGVPALGMGIGSDRVVSAQGPADGPPGDSMGGAPTVTSALAADPFQAPLRLPTVLTPVETDATTDYYEMTMREALIEIVPGYRTPIWGFNGEFPGPIIRARRGRPVVVRQVNRLPDATVTHLHGGHSLPEMDGHPEDLVEPGAFRDYEYPNSQPAATLWYHDHVMDLTGPHIYQGLAGMYVIEDENEAALGLPSREYDVPLVIQDRAFNADGSLRYERGGMMAIMRGVLADVILVNGGVQPFFEVAARKYRFRLLNGSNARHYELGLGDAQPIVVIASDGGLLPSPVTVSTLVVAPGERYELVIDFSPLPVGTSIVLQDYLGVGAASQIMRFDVVRQEPDSSTIPTVLRPILRLSESEATVTRDFMLARSGGAAGPMGPQGGGGMGMADDPWVINGRPFDPERIDATPRLDSVEIWRFINTSNMSHPIHMHDVMFQVLDRDGRLPRPSENGWKDTVQVGPSETVRVLTRFTDYTGRYVFHCHVLEHEDHRMMGQFQVI